MYIYNQWLFFFILRIRILSVFFLHLFVAFLGGWGIFTYIYHPLIFRLQIFYWQLTDLLVAFFVFLKGEPADAVWTSEDQLQQPLEPMERASSSSSSEVAQVEDVVGSSSASSTHSSVTSTSTTTSHYALHTLFFLR